MPDAIDARGLACPEPSDLAFRALLSSKPERLVVLIDDPASREQLQRLAAQFSYDLEVTRADGHDRLEFRRRGA